MARTDLIITGCLVRAVTVLIPALLLTACAGLPVRPAADALEIHFIDVGYGDAILVRKGDAAFFVDGGYPPMTGVVLDHLRAAGIDHLDALVLTHPHPDHVGGAFGILASEISVDSLITAWPMADPAIPEGFRTLVGRMVSDDGLEVRVVRDGDRVEVTAAWEFDVVHPVELQPDWNEASMVIRLDGFGGHVLLTADIGPGSQQRLLDVHPELFPVRILKAPHHGGHSLEAFYRAAGPMLTIIPDGVNPYGNPHGETMAAAERWSRQVIRLSRSGTVIIREIGNAGYPFHLSTNRKH